MAPLDEAKDLEIEDIDDNRQFKLEDVSDTRELSAYAATAQVAYMGSGSTLTSEPLTQNEIAALWWLTRQPRRQRRSGASRTRPASVKDLTTSQRRNASSQFSKALKKPAIEFLQELDGLILREEPEMSRAGGLAAFTARLDGVRDARNVEARISLLWTPWLLLEREPEQPIIVLLQACALLSKYEGKSVKPTAEDEAALARVVERLILIGGLPPTPYSVDALILLGSISRIAFRLVETRLHQALRTPFGFRVWRAITAIVVAIKKRGEVNTQAGRTVRDWVKHQLSACEELRENSIYPARSLDLELAIVVPTEWSPNEKGQDWAGDVLRRRAANPSFTLRERGTAAFGLWERAVNGKYPEQAKPELEQLIAEFDKESPSRPGLSWVAGVLRENLREGRAILTSWPDLGEPCQAIIRRAGRHLERIPDRIRPATEILFQHAVIKNAGVYRRRAIETLRAGGWAAEVMPALRAVVEDDDTEPWLRCRALFAMGFLQERGPQAQEALQAACNDAWDRLQQPLDDSPASKVQVIELATALFAVGDAFGDPAAAGYAEQMRGSIDSQLSKIIAAVREDNNKAVKDRRTAHLIPVARALAYLLGSSAHARPTRSKQMLAQLEEVADPPTRRLCTWGLARFDGDHVKPSHDVELKHLDLDDDLRTEAEWA